MKATTTISRVQASAAVLAVFGTFLFAFQATGAAFSAQTVNAGNAFAAGTVVISDNDSDAAMFNVGNMKPGDTVVGCIEVTYSGSLDSQIRIYGASTGGDGLEAYLDLTIERGDDECSQFGTSTTVGTNNNDGDLGVFLGSVTNYGTGVDTWQPTGGGNNDTVPYRFTITLQDDNLAQGKTASVGFTWEAQNV